MTVGNRDGRRNCSFGSITARQRDDNIAGRQIVATDRPCCSAPVFTHSLPVNRQRQLWRFRRCEIPEVLVRQPCEGNSNDVSCDEKIIKRPPPVIATFGVVAKQKRPARWVVHRADRDSTACRRTSNEAFVDVAFRKGCIIVRVRRIELQQLGPVGSTVVADR